MSYGQYLHFKFGMTSGLHKRMRVLVIGHAYSAVYNRKDKLVRLAHNPNLERLGLIVPNKWHDRMMKLDRTWKNEDFDQAYDVFAVPTLFTGSQRLHLYLPIHLYKAIRDFRPDIIHMEQEPHDWVSAQVCLLNRYVFHKKLILFTWENLDRSTNLVTRFLRKFVLSTVDHMIAGNTAAGELVRHQGYDRELAVLPQFGVDAERFRPMNVADLRGTLELNDTSVYGFIGRYTREKGIHTLIDAFEKLSAQNLPNAVLMLVSSMVPPPWLQEKVIQFGKRIRIIDSIPHEDLPRYINLFDTLILPSEESDIWKEQFGRVMIEAMACGVPVIGSSSGAIPEVIGEYGFVFPEKDSTALTLTMQRVLTDTNSMNRLKQRVRMYILNTYTHERIAHKTVDIWKKLHIEK